MIDLKLIIIFLLSAAPFTLAMKYRPKWAVRFHEGMKRSDNFRKFFTLMVLIVMIIIQYIDFHASCTIAKMMQESNYVESADTIAYAALMSRPYATLIAVPISLSFFSFKMADLILTWLHGHPKAFIPIGLTLVGLLAFFPRYVLVAELVFIILFAAYLYPIKIGKNVPQMSQH